MKSIVVYKCPHCGHDERMLDKFCSECGREIIYRSPPIKPTQKEIIIDIRVCPKCGKEFKNEEKFCPKDGTLIIKKKERVIVRYS